MMCVAMRAGTMRDQKPRRNTRQRTVVLEELKKLSRHPTAAELYQIARARMPKLSLGTVYRNLVSFLKTPSGRGWACRVESWRTHARPTAANICGTEASWRESRPI